MNSFRTGRCRAIAIPFWRRPTDQRTNGGDNLANADWAFEDMEPEPLDFVGRQTAERGDDQDALDRKYEPHFIQRLA
jgi:hypothetical protein